MTPRTPGGTAARPAGNPGDARGAREPAIPAVPHTSLLLAEPFARLPPEAVADALASGLRAGGRPEVEVCGLQQALAAPHTDARLRRARAVIIAQRRLSEGAPRDSAAFEIATRARQAGVPCFAVTARNGLSAFYARMLDLQLVVQATDKPTLARAGRAIAAAL